MNANTPTSTPQPASRAELPEIETWPNQYPPATRLKSRCRSLHRCARKTGLPDHGTLTLSYVPDQYCLELKSLKMYTVAYRNLGIFQENVVNRMLADVVKAARPVSATLVGEFTPRGGVYTKITASWSRSRKRAR